MRNTKWTGGALALGLLLAAALSLPARAELQVMSSSVPGLAAGARLPDNTKFDVAKGQSVKVLKMPGGSTHVINGPFTGSLDEFTEKAGCPLWRRILGQCPASDTTGTVTRGYIAPRKNTKDEDK